MAPSCIHGGRSGVSGGSGAPARCVAAYPPATAATPPVRTVPGAAFPDHPVHWGRVIRGIFSPPVLLQAQQERSTQQAHGYVVMPAGPATGLVFVQAHVALFRLELRFNGPGTAHIGGSPGEYPRQRWTGSSGLAAVQVSAVDGPCLLARLALPGYPHPLGAEHIAPRPLASLGHRYLPPSLIRQLATALLHGTTLPALSLGLRGRPDPWRPRTGPSQLQGPDRSAARNVQHVAHPQARQGLPKGRRHPEGVRPRQPIRP